MATTANRNWAAMLKEKKAVTVAPKAAVALPEDKPAPKAEEPKPAAEVPAVAAEPSKAEEKAPVVEAPAKATPPPAKATLPPAKATPPPAPAAAAEPAAPEVAYTAFGPVSLPETLAKLVKPKEFRFVGSLAAPVVAEETPAAPATPPQPLTVTVPAEAAPPAMTSSSDIHHPQQWSHHRAPYNPPVNFFVPQYDGPRPYGGELGSVPRFYNAERHFNNVEHQYNAQPYHPTYQTPYYPSHGGYNGGYQYNAYDTMHPSYYPGQGAPYMGGRLQANPPYYPPRDPPQQQQQQ